MDYRAFLTSRDPIVLPYFGGIRVDAADRRLAVPTGLAPGWWRFRIEGRRAVPIEPAAPVDLGALPAVRGHFATGWIVMSGRVLSRLALAPEDEPPPLARATARRWHSGELLFDTTDFEDDAELAARDALERGVPLGDVKGVAPSLRAAFGLALGTKLVRELGVHASARELFRRAVAIADTGRDALQALVDQLAAERERDEARRKAEREARRVSGAVASARERPRAHDPIERADNALAQAGARMLACRRLQNGTLLDVTCDIDGERIIATVDAVTLHVHDAGICLDGADEEITLDSLPSVVREAIANDVLNITRH